MYSCNILIEYHLYTNKYWYTYAIRYIMQYTYTFSYSINMIIVNRKQLNLLSIVKITWLFM